MTTSGRLHRWAPRHFRYVLCSLGIHAWRRVHYVEAKATVRYEACETCMAVRGRRGGHVRPIWFLAWVLLWFPVFLGIRGILAGIVGLMWGPRAAKKFWGSDWV